MTDNVTIAQLDAIIDEEYPQFLADGLRTGPADREVAAEVVRDWYRLIDEAPEIVFAASPHAAERLARETLGTTEHIGTWCWGAADLFWLARHDVARRRLGVQYDEEDARLLDQYLRLARACGEVYFLDRLAIICDRPEEIHVVETERGPILHREGGMAIRYSDGEGVSSLWDVTVPHWLAAGRAEDLDPAKVVAIEHVDQRRVGIRRVGLARVLKHLDARVLDEDTVETADGRQHPYRLLAMHLPGASAESRALEMIYPSGPEAGSAVVEWTPPWVETCEEARMWKVMGVETREDFEARRGEWSGEPSVLT